jgi:hypothetical protein
LPRPENCDEDLWILMRDCWNMWPNRRPNFLKICERLKHLADDRFREKSFIMSDQGQRAIEAFAEEQAEREAAEEAAATSETMHFLPANRTTGNGNHNGNNEEGNGSRRTNHSSGGGGDQVENGQVSSGSGAVELKQLNRQVSAPTSNSGGALIGGNSSGSSIKFIPKITAAMPNGFKKRNKSGSAAAAAAAASTSAA